MPIFSKFGQEKPIKVLMIGGRRCGKTSALASLFDQMQNGATNTVFSVADRTEPERKVNPKTGKEESKDSLINKRYELINFIDKGGNETFIVDQAPTTVSWEYNMQIQIPGTNKRCRMDFMDVPGEYYEPNNMNYMEVEKFIKESSVFVIVIDTPFMMEGSRAENNAANCMDKIHSFLSVVDVNKEVDNKEVDNEEEFKQIIFVPVKCEKWMQTKDGQNEIVKKIEESYKATLNHFKATANTEITVIPIQTAGDILFDSLRPAYTVVNTETGERSIKKCSKVSDRLVIDGNGMHYKLKDNEIINDHPDGFFTNTDIAKPFAWYNLKQYKEGEGKAEYNPYNCEQIALHILRFMFKKFESEAPGGFWGWLSSAFSGTITVEDMQNCLNKLSKANLIKDNIEGIKTIKKCF